MLSRRDFLSAGAAAATIIGFNPLTQTWVTDAHARPNALRLPRLDGELLVDPAQLAEFSTDAGNLIFETPVALLRPRSTRDIAKMVRFCRRHHIVVAARGQGHTMFGQSLAGGGLMIEMATLNSVHTIEADKVDADAGITWRQLLAQTLPLGLTPPVLTGYIGLSLGGTLSVGGISRGYARGSQVDHVLELEVVTGRGHIVRCSETRRRGLFLACLAGLGQFGIITRVVVRLVPAKQMVRSHTLPYVDNATFFSDMRSLLARGEFDDVYGAWAPDGSGGWIYLIVAASFYNPEAPPDDATLLRELNYIPPMYQVADTTYHDYSLEVDVAVEGLKAAGLWHGVFHPWFDVWLPGRHVEQYIGEVIPTLTPQDVGEGGFMLMFPQRRSSLTRPFLRVPHDEWVYLFDVLTAVVDASPQDKAQMLERNRTLFEQARALGGTRYPIGMLEFTQRDWKRQYGLLYPLFRSLKHRFDPKNILTPGVRV